MSNEAVEFWEHYGPEYQRSCQIPVDVHYGPGSPNEAHLQLIGPVAGKRILEVGCGGAQCSVAFALQGAIVTAIDPAASQLAFARALAARHRVTIAFHQTGGEDLSPIDSDSQDIVFSAYALGYVPDLAGCFREVYRVLKEDGLFVWSDGHPCFLLDKETKQMSQSYFDTWNVDVNQQQQTMSGCINLMLDAGFVLERVVEPDSRERYPDDPWYGMWDYVPELMALLPPTIIFKARKRERVVHAVGLMLPLPDA